MTPEQIAAVKKFILDTPGVDPYVSDVLKLLDALGLRLTIVLKKDKP